MESVRAEAGNETVITIMRPYGAEPVKHFWRFG